MKTKQHHFLNGQWKDFSSDLANEKCQLVLAFGSPECIVKNEEVFVRLKETYPNAHIVLSSTAGEIIDGSVFDDSVVATAIQFEKTKIKAVKTSIHEHQDGYQAGLFLKNQLAAEDLSGIFIIADGTLIDGADLARGFKHNNERNIPITGGLAGDAARFEKTFTGLDEAPAQGNIIAVGFYGKDILIGHGSLGGWDEFGIERVITRSEKNVLQELDNENALDLYKKYLGSYADELPGSALMFPLSMKVEGSDRYLIRTVLGVDNDEKKMIFAGNMPAGSTSRLMTGNFNKLINASAIAAKDALAVMEERKPDLTLLVSCVGRKIILHSRVVEEVEAAEEVLNGGTVSGFYSYGGISPFGTGTPCELHNQTMTITTFAEV